jgi:hypothetical protein
MLVSRLARSIGTGILAGVAGTAAMTISSTIEMKLRGRPGSKAPAKAAEKLLAIEEFSSDAAENRFGNVVHWTYGTGWGAFRGLLRGIGLTPGWATGVHFAAMWGGEQVALPALDVAPPATQWSRQEVAIDLGHHVVYEAASTLAYEWLNSRP